MERKASKLKLAALLAVTIEYLIYSAISKGISLTVSSKSNIQLALAVPPVPIAKPSKKPQKASTKKKAKIEPAVKSVSPIFSPEETLCSRTLASLKEGKKYLECLYQVKKLRIRNKTSYPRFTLEPLFNI